MLKKNNSIGPYVINPALAYAIILCLPPIFNSPSGPSQNITSPKLGRPIFYTPFATPSMPSGILIFPYAVFPTSDYAGVPRNSCGFGLMVELRRVWDHCFKDASKPELPISHDGLL